MYKDSPIVIYRDWLLPSSETFILAQAEALKNFVPYYVGSCFKDGLVTPPERTIVVNRGGHFGRAQEVFYKLTGLAPTFFQKLQRLNPILIHAHFGTGGSQSLPISRRLQIPLLVTYHGYDELITDDFAKQSFYSHRVYLKRREALKQEAQLFICVSNFSKTHLLQQGFPSDKVIVHYIGIDTDAFQPDLDVKREPIVLFVARLVEKKGCEYLIRAMSLVQSIRPDAELVIIGDGELRLPLEQQAKKQLQRYRFLGRQSPDNVRAWMNRAKVFCVPSVTAQSGDAEGFGMVFAEAQAMGLPVVSFAHGGITEAVAHQEVGFLAAERDWQKLAQYIILLLQEEALWQRFSEFGIRRVHSLFNLHQQTKLLEDIYEQVLKKFRIVTEDSTKTNEFVV